MPTLLRYKKNGHIQNRHAHKLCGKDVLSIHQLLFLATDVIKAKWQKYFKMEKPLAIQNVEFVCKKLSSFIHYL